MEVVKRNTVNKPSMPTDDKNGVLQPIGEVEMNTIIYGIDIAKHVFQLHWIEPETGEIQMLKLKRRQFLTHFSRLSPCSIGMEACGGAHHWARELVAMGHKVKLLPGKQVTPFVTGNKNDVADARAIWTALQQPGIKTVAIKTEAQQAVLALHRMREQLVKFRTAQINGLRGLLTEYGEVMPVGRSALRKALPDVLARLDERLPAMLIEGLREQWARVLDLDTQVKTIESRLRQWFREDEACQRVADIPGVGLLTATAIVVTMGAPDTFKSGREFAAWLGLVPRQTGTGGRVRLHGISKRGDTYIRTLLIHGARSVMTHCQPRSPWLTKLLSRRPANIALVALANKTARTIWALLAHGRSYQIGYVSQTV